MSYFHITLHRSAIGLPQRTRDALAALGLRRRSQVVVHAVSPSVAGLVFRVKELVRVREVTTGEAALLDAATAGTATAGTATATAGTGTGTGSEAAAAVPMRARLRARALDSAVAASSYGAAAAASSLRVPAPGYTIVRRHDAARQAAAVAGAAGSTKEGSATA